jgi:hypothetical protein
MSYSSSTEKLKSTNFEFTGLKNTTPRDCYSTHLYDDCSNSTMSSEEEVGSYTKIVSLAPPKAPRLRYVHSLILLSNSYNFIPYRPQAAPRSFNNL